MDAESITSPPTAPPRRYCPLEPGETVAADDCVGCPFLPEPPFRICAPPRWARARRRGFWDREPDLE